LGSASNQFASAVATISTSADGLASASDKTAVAAAALKEAAESLGTRGEKSPPVEMNSYGSAMDHLASARRADRQPMGGLDAAPDTSKVSVMTLRKRPIRHDDMSGCVTSRKCRHCPLMSAIGKTGH